jgi:hypothetical protein
MYVLNLVSCMTLLYRSIHNRLPLEVLVQYGTGQWAKTRTPDKGTRTGTGNPFPQDYMLR